MRKNILPLLLVFFPVNGSCFFFGSGKDRAAEMLGSMRAYFEKGDCSAVLGKADFFLNERPSSELKEEAYQYMGRCYEKEGLADRAIGLYQLASGLYPDNHFFAARLAGIYLDTGFYENSAALFEKIVAARPDDPEASLGLARAYARLGFLSKAKTYYSLFAALTNFGERAVLREYASVMLKKRDWGEVLMLAEQGRRTDPENPFWPQTLARLQAGKGDYKKAWDHMNSAVKMSPESRSLALERALYMLLSGNPGSAAASADEALARIPGDPLASLIKAMALFKEGKNGKARSFFEAASKNGEPFTAEIAAAFLKITGAQR